MEYYIEGQYFKRKNTEQGTIWIACETAGTTGISKTPFYTEG
jgi:hypothetical protein